MSKKRKFKNIIHDFKVKAHAKARAEKQNENAERPDDNLNFMSATFQDIKQGDFSHELNRMRRLAIKYSLNKYEHPASNHGKLEPYQKTSDWLDWIGVVSDISMPTGKSGKLDGKLLIDKFSFENDYGQKELLDYHIWLPVNEIRFLLNTHSQIVGIGDTIRGKSKVIQYSSKGHGAKYGLGATLIKDVGIYVSFKKVGSEHISIGRQLESGYNRFDDWVLKLSNDGIPKKAIQQYQENRDINVFTDRTNGHVDAIYQPSKYDRYFDRLSPLEIADKVNSESQNYTADIKDFDVKKYDGETMPIIHLANITNERKRLVSAGGWYQYDMSLAELGALKPKDQIQFTASPQYFRDHTEKQTLENPVLITKRKTDKLPENKILLCGWIMSQKKIKNPSDTVQDWINQYEFWAKSNEKPDEITDGLSAKSLAIKGHTSVEAVQAYINQNKVKPLFVSNDKEYYLPDELSKLAEYLKASNEKVKDALQEVKKTKQKLSVKQNDGAISLSSKTASPAKSSSSKSTENTVKKIKSATSPKVIEKGFCLKITTSEGDFTSYEFKGMDEAFRTISGLAKKQDHNEFLKTYDSNHKLRFLSVKDIKSFGQ